MTGTRERLRAERRHAHRSVVAGSLSAVLPGLGEDGIDALLNHARADKGTPLRELAEHLASHPDALFTGNPRCPAALIRLTHILYDTGYMAVVRPGCAGCGKVTTGLDPAPDGRLCPKCYARAAPRHPCARCGRMTRTIALRPEGGICSACYAKDPLVTEPCGQCGRRRRPVSRAADGSARCQSCSSRPSRTCVTCGNLAPAQAITDTGPVCKRCYRAPHRKCGGCGQVRRISKRATADRPDLCFNCYPGPEAVCAVCGRTRPSHRSSLGETFCRTCRPRPRRECCRCGQSRPVHADWPIGPVCRSCYQAVRSNPGPCGRCGERRALIGIDGHGGSICGACAGAKTDYSCRKCGRGRRLYAEGCCAACVLADRLRDLLADPDGHIRPVLMPVYTALAATRVPRTVLSWCHRSPTAQLLARLAAEGRPLTHGLLDELPQRPELHFARQMLVHTGVLPERAEYLERIGPWLDKTLAGHPAEHARIIQPYAHWVVLRRARRSAARRPYTSGAGRSARSRITRALEFLAWLEQRGLTMETLQQADVDEWLATGSGIRVKIGYFLAWAHSRGLAGRLTVPSRPRGQTADLLGEDERYQQLQRCLLEETLPNDVRVAGALVLLFGLPLTKIVRLTADLVTGRGGAIYLQLDQSPVFLPPRLAKLILLHTCLLRPLSSISRDINGVRWLFPGLMPGRPLTANTLSRKLSRHGINARPGQHTALILLASELPAPVLAQVTGMHINTAVRWGKYAERDWAAYVAERIAPAPSETGGTPEAVRDIGDHEKVARLGPKVANTQTDGHSAKTRKQRPT